jgi:hypothetical protein
MLREIFDNLEKHCGKFDTYFDVYESHLSKFIGRSPVVVEVGICRGGSAEMWQKYFGAGATVIGIDVDENVKQYATDGCEQIIGDQGDPAFWDEFFKTHPDIDVFIDDGGHHQFQQINTLIKVWPHMKLGGVYICEDTHTCYWPEYSGGGLKKSTSFLEYVKTISDLVNVDHFRDSDRHPDVIMLADYYENLQGLHFYDSMVVLDKNIRNKSQLITSTPI